MALCENGPEDSGTFVQGSVMPSQIYGYRLRVLALWLGVAIILAVGSGGRVMAGEYLSSSHGNTTTGVQRTSMTAYAIGNCAHCHEQHASVAGSEPVPTGGPDRYLGMEYEEDLCLACHKAGGISNAGAPDNINTDIGRTHNHITVAAESGHTDGSHRQDETLAGIAAARHVECTDCHNSHKAIKGNHSAGNRYQTSSGNLIDNDSGAGNTSPLYGAAGAAQDYSTATSTWATPAQNTYTLSTATYEYEVCFKCHSGANAKFTGVPQSPTTASSPWDIGSGASALTDVGLEFNPYNNSFHPVVKALNWASSNSTVLDAGQLAGSWAPGDTMYCSDCHASDDGIGGVSAVAGPHGSSVKWMLAGANKAWPYTTTAGNGTNSGTQFNLGDTPFAGLFCLNCHPAPDTTNNIHSSINHQDAANGQCLFCHIRVPHGGKVSRLVAADNPGTGLPARYYPNGDGTGTRYLERYLKAAWTGYAATNCRASCHATHASEAVVGYESW